MAGTCALLQVAVSCSGMCLNFETDLPEGATGAGVSASARTFTANVTLRQSFTVCGADVLVSAALIRLFLAMDCLCRLVDPRARVAAFTALS